MRQALETVIRCDDICSILDFRKEKAALFLKEVAQATSTL